MASRSSIIIVIISLCFSNTKTVVFLKPGKWKDYYYSPQENVEEPRRWNPWAIDLQLHDLHL